jgi:hypothetical protein
MFDLVRVFCGRLGCSCMSSLVFKRYIGLACYMCTDEIHPLLRSRNDNDINCDVGSYMVCQSVGQQTSVARVNRKAPIVGSKVKLARTSKLSNI